jgi:SPP1 gp7 family putative phage head morphogenesis protein
MTTRDEARAALKAVIIQVADKLAEHVDLPDNLKTRDKREPGRLEKMRFEDKLAALFMRRWRKQAEKVKRLVMMMPQQAKVALGRIDFALPDEDEQEFNAALIRLITASAQRGTLLTDFGIDIDWTLTNMNAAKWASKYAGELVKEIDAKTLQVIQDAVTRFVETPGMTIGDVMDALPFDEVRALRVATTEITRAYAKGQMIAGQQLKDEYPDVKITKTWFTNNDDKVCPICEPLDGKEFDFEDEFDAGITEPAAHVNCRCWMSTGTRLVNA